METPFGRIDMKRTIILLTLLLASVACADEAPTFQVFPHDVNLEAARDAQSIVCQVTQPDGVTRDVTKDVQFVVPDSNLVRMEGNVAHPLADGTGELKVKYQDQVVSLPLKVKDAKVDRPVSFKLDVMPVFMRAGCNAGSCHGSARGKD